jgi:hypothetical protein
MGCSPLPRSLTPPGYRSQTRGAVLRGCGAAQIVRERKLEWALQRTGETAARGRKRSPAAKRRALRRRPHFGDCRSCVARHYCRRRRRRCLRTGKASRASPTASQIRRRDSRRDQSEASIVRDVNAGRASSGPSTPDAAATVRARPRVSPGTGSRNALVAQSRERAARISRAYERISADLATRNLASSHSGASSLQVMRPGGSRAGSRNVRAAAIGARHRVGIAGPVGGH